VKQADLSDMLKMATIDYPCPSESLAESEETQNYLQEFRSKYAKSDNQEHLKIWQHTASIQLEIFYFDMFFNYHRCAANKIKCWHQEMYYMA